MKADAKPSAEKGDKVFQSVLLDEMTACHPARAGDDLDQERSGCP
jgi:hypothetical protein